VISYRHLNAVELPRVAEIDRTERIDTIHIQRGTELETMTGEFSASSWRNGDGTHSVGEQIEECEHYLAAGGTALGAFAGTRLVGIGVVVPHFRAGVAQLAYLHVSQGFRRQGIGMHLTEALERIAREAGDTEMVVSATPSANTVAFYRGRGFRPAPPLPELFELEPEDVHMAKHLGP
jgi:GNAT superfamily N-acetyltransferase